MADAQLEKTIAKIEISGNKDYHFEATGEVLKFDGFLKVYRESKEEEDDEEAKGILPPLSIGQNLDLKIARATQRFTKPPARYTEAGLVKKLEELGIGRPSTYAPTISKIMEEDRGYIIKENRPGVERKYTELTLSENQIGEHQLSEMAGAISNRLIPTDLGMIVTDFLQEHFDDIMDYRFTANIEEQFDEIADGNRKWKEMLGDFYEPFHKDVEETLEQAKRATGQRELGKDEATGYTVAARMTRFGPVIQIGLREEVGEEEKPRFANLNPGQSIETITFDEAMELFKLPRALGEYEGSEVSVNNGRYGPYVKYGDAFVSLGRNADPMQITLDEAIELIKEKQKEDAPIYTYQEKPVTKGKGRFGPFIKWDGMFINIPKRYDPEDLNEQQIVELIEQKIEKEANRYIQKWEKEKIAIENGRWGPFIRFKRKSVKLPKNAEGKKMTSEEAANLSLEDVKKAIEAEIPNAFPKRKKKAVK